MAIDKLKTSSLEDNSVTSVKIAPGAVTITDIGDSEISMAKLSQVDLAIAPETLEIQVDAPAAGQDTTWLWTWEQSTLPYARRTITNSPELSVPLYKQGTYTINNFAAYVTHGNMTQTHSLYLKWIDGAGTDNLVSWATSAGPISDTHPSINGGNATNVQRISVSVPSTITPPSLTNPSVSYTVANNGAGAYTFSGSAAGDNPNLGPFYRGGTYTINISATGHPFYFTTDNGTNFSAGTYFGEYTTGVTGSRTDSGTITFTVPAGAPDTLYYQCGNHSVMRGAITVKDLAVETNINGNYVVYFQHTQEGHRTPVELRPIPSLVNQMCLVYDSNTDKFVPQDLATYVENTPSFENKIREVAGTAELVVEDGSAVIAKVTVYDDSTYLPLTGNNAGDQAFATDTNILYIWDGSAWQQAGTTNSDDLTEGSTNKFFTDERVDDRVNALLIGGNNITATYNDAAGTLTIDGQPGYTDADVNNLIVGGNNITATYDSNAGTLTLDGQPGYTNSDVGTYLSNNDYDTATNIVASITDSAPATLDTLNELAAALGDDPNFATTTANNIALKAPIAGPTFTGTATADLLSSTLHLQGKSIPNGSSYTIPSDKQVIVESLDIIGDLDVQGTLATLNGGSLSQTTMKTQAIAHTNNTTAINIASDGKVGIGTDNPAVRLEIKDNNTWDTTNFTSSNTVGSGFTLAATDTGVRWSVIAQGTTGGGNDNNLGYHLTNAGTSGESTGYKFVMTPSGRFGIGTSSPGADYGSDKVLEIKGASSPGLVINDTGQAAKYGIHADSNDLKITYGTGTLATFQNDGKVGIGTTSPTAPFVVSNGGDEGWEIHPALLGANHNRITNFNRASSTYCDLTTDAASFTHRINGDDNEKLEFVSNGLNLKSATYAILNVQTDVDDNNPSSDGIVKISNGSSGITKAELRWDESEDKVHLSYGDHGRHISIQPNGRVGIGTGSGSINNFLHVSSGASGGPQIELESTSGTANSGFIGFDGTSLQISTQRDMVDGSKRDTAKSWGGINIVGQAAGSSINFTTSEGNNNNASTKMNITKEGYVTMPYQPAFDVAQPAQVSGDHTFNQIHLNRGSHYNNSNGRFTAPVAGVYVFNFGGIKNGNSTTTVRLYVKKNGSRLHSQRHLRLDGGQVNTYGDNGSVQWIAELAVNDYIQAETGAGTIYNATGEYTTFSGYLIG